MTVADGGGRFEFGMAAFVAGPDALSCQERGS
jgi:hypothetical protein